MSRALRNPVNWRYLSRPEIPSWGEPYARIVDRMQEAMRDMWTAHRLRRRRHREPPASDLGDAPRRGRPAHPARPAAPSLRAVERDQLRARRRCVARDRLRRAGLDGGRGRRGGGVMRSIRSRTAAALLAATVVLTLAGCANDPLAEQYRAGDNKGFIAGDRSIVEIPIDQRGEPVEFAATTETGAEVASADYSGDVLVVNFWYAACGPCRAEADDLEEAYTSVRRRGRRLPRHQHDRLRRDRRGVRRDLRHHLPERDRVRDARDQARVRREDAHPGDADHARAGWRGPGGRPHHRPAARPVDPEDARARHPRGELVNPGAIVTDGGLWLALPIAVLAGLVSFLSPVRAAARPGVPRIHRRRRGAPTRRRSDDRADVGRFDRKPPTLG